MLQTYSPNTSRYKTGLNKNKRTTSFFSRDFVCLASWHYGSPGIDGDHLAVFSCFMGWLHSHVWPHGRNGWETGFSWDYWPCGCTCPLAWWSEGNSLLRWKIRAPDMCSKRQETEATCFSRPRQSVTVLTLWVRAVRSLSDSRGGHRPILAILDPLLTAMHGADIRPGWELSVWPQDRAR